jgi:hypothetical protein
MMDNATFLEHVTQWLQIRRAMTRAAAEALVTENSDYLIGAHERDVDAIRAASYIHALAWVE